MITPIRKDKRFLLTASTVLAVVGLGGCGHALDQQTLTFLGLTLAAFMGQSQWGQTKRMTSGVTADPESPAP